MVFLLLAGGVMNSVWATDVTYHILTLPIDNSVYHMKAELSDKRLEAFKVTVTGQSQLELPAAYKSPLVGSFTYYAASDVTVSGSAVKLFDATNNQNKAFYYTIKGGASPVAEKSGLSGSKADYYVVYTYDASNTIAKLDGSVKYNINIVGYDNKGVVKEKGFLAYNRGRNNRPAVLPKGKVDPEMLSSEDFMKVDVSGTSVSPYWSSGDNKNKQALTGSKFHFMFEFIGNDPYNIIIRTAYDKDTTYIEKNDNSNPAEFVYKFYKKGSLFSNGTANTYFASDEHRHYNYPYNSSLPDNPTNLTEGSGTGWDVRNGYYHGQNGTIRNSFALLNNSKSTGFVFMGTRMQDSGNTPTDLYYLKEVNTCNNLQILSGDATNNLSIEGIYPIKKLTFKVATPFYDPESPSDAHIISVSDQVSQYTVENDVIETKYLPDGLKRKYINFNGNFYKDAACTQQITKFSEANYDNTEGYKVYVGYDIAPDAPKFLSPSDSYTTATWYELTDEGSVQESGRKIKWDATNEVYKNNGANGEYEKESEFALVGDPYELKVLYRKGTEDAEENRYVTLSTFYTWDIPDDETDGSFLLRKYNATGYWSWDAGQASVAVTYGSDESTSVDKDAHTVKINLTGLNGGKYYKITTDGTGASQIVSVTPEVDNVTKETGTTLTVVVSLAANTSNDAQEMTVTIQEYNDAEGNTPSESPANPSVITITQTTASSSFAGNTVTYSTTSFTRVKVLDLPTRTYTYNIVDKSGRIAVKASTKQTIFSALSLLSSVPSIIISPLIADETVTFYSTFDSGSGAGTGTSRTHLSGQIAETPDADSQIYVKYTTSKLKNKPVTISENQEFNVVLNGRYLWYDSSDNSVKTMEAPGAGELKKNKYLWKLRNLDPYAMLIDNLEARTDLGVSGDEDVTVYDDNGGTTTESRQKGAWVTLALIANEGAISFTTRRSAESAGVGLYAQPFVAKASVQTGVYEVMVATGDGVDASTTYYNIGCPADNTVKIYYNDIVHGGYSHGNDVLKFHLEQSTPYTYYLIDKAKHKLLTLTSQNPDLALPADYQSPLVAAYKYYAANNISIDDKETPSTSDDEYTPINAAAILSALSDLEVAYDDPTSSDATEWGKAVAPYQKTATDELNMLSQVRLLEVTGEYIFRLGESESYTYKAVNVTRGYRGRAIYVTYTRNSSIPFGTSNPYTLKFLEPFAEGYYLEDGVDKLTTSKIKAVYPYCNGDGNLNIYGEEMKTEQFGGGSSTRPRWIWYFDSEDDDPYHVRIRSRSTISYNSVSHPTYLTTYAVHFNQDTGDDADKLRIVTGGTLPGVASLVPTEYMIVGSAGAYKLMTTNEISDGLTSERRKVTSLEQYWKTYNMVKLDVLGVSASTDAYSDDASTWVVPSEDDPTTGGVDESTYRTILVGKDWHSYDAYANAVRWNGYNNKSDGHEKKVVEKLEHWFQTFNMGNGTFDIESADIPPVLVLLDLHGWEIMRLPLPTDNYPYGDDELAALRAYDSPMVDSFFFYSNATKATGCHKYTLRLDDKTKAERDQIKVDGKRYGSTSLGDLPPITATGVKSSGAFNDQFVTYTVKEEYAKSYTYNLELDEEHSTYTESGTASKFLVLLRSRFLRDNGSGTSYNSKPIYEASNPVGGNVYDAILDPQRETHANVSTAVDISPQDGKIDDINLWYLQPNLNIDKEMGIKWGTSNDTTNAEPLSEFGTKKKYQKKTGFDPYNIQLKNADVSGVRNLFLTSHQTSAVLHDGVLIGDYSGVGGNTNITLENEYDYSEWDPLYDTHSEGYDHTNLTISNQTFMAVSDANGNMQLMPRFDHTKRVNLVNNSDKSHTTLQDPVNHPKASATDNTSMGTQTMFFVRPQRLEYHIIDNEGKESIRYKRAGDEYPAVTAHFKSPVAKDFTYYTGLAVHGDVTSSSVGEWGPATAEFKRTATTDALVNTQINLLPKAGTYYYQIGLRGDFHYSKVTVTKGLDEQEIKGALAAETLTDNHVYVRYDYDEDADHDADKILEGKWFTVKLANKDLQADGTVMKYVRLVADNAAYAEAVAILSTDGVYYFKIGPVAGEYTYKKVTVDGETKTPDNILEPEWTTALNLAGLGVNLFADDAVSPTKPATIDEDDKKWQWKFLAVLANPISDYYEKPDPYNVRIYNRYANYTDNPSLTPNPMNIGIKVPNETTGANHFALLSHPNGGYALAVAGKVSDFYTYTFLNGADMTTSVGATTATEASFTQKTGIISAGSQLVLNNDVKHNFVYNVINKANKLAVSATQDEGAAEAHSFFPYLPEAAQSPLLRMKDYRYYGSAIPTSPGYYNVIPYSIVYTLYGGYDDVVWVQYEDYHVDSTEFKVPNKKAIVDGHVAKDPTSVDASLNINGELPYNIIWYNDNMMSTNEEDTEINSAASHSLDGNHKYVWYIIGGDPYALKIKHKLTGGYVDGTTTLTNEAGAKEFMLLKKSGYDYGILQVTGTTGDDAGKKLTGYGEQLTSTDPEDANYEPKKFIIFGLSVHDLIYRLIIAKTCTNEEIEKDKSHTIVLDPSKYVDIPYRETQGGSETLKRIYGSTQRDLKSENTGEGTHYTGEKYQLGETVTWGGEGHTYSYHAGAVSIGDDLTVPNVFNRPNCTFEFYIAGIFDGTTGDELTDLETKYKGLKLNKLMSDADLIDETVVVNIVYKFNEDLATNNGMDFVRSTEDKCWYTFETSGGGTPYLAHYTNAWGLQSMEGRETRYTNDYLWTPVGDVYGFKLYNRYMIKNSDGSDKVMTFDGTISEGKNLAVAKPGSTVDTKTYTSGNEVFELLTGDNPNSGYFRVHPVVNNSGTQYYVRRDAEDDYTKLSTTSSDWTFGLDMSLMEPYYERAGYVGGLTPAGKEAYETARDKVPFHVMDIQHVVFDDANIITFTPGYYRLHNQPGVSGISPVRYASGYLHETEKTAVSGGIPMHFYSKQGVNTTFTGLGSGFTETHATRGDIPVPATEDDPSTIFYLNGSITNNPTISEASMSTQGLNVSGNKMTTETGTTFTLIDIGGATFLITDKLDPATRNYFNFDQTSNIYDLKFAHEVPTDDAKWCLQPVQKTATAGNGEMPLNIRTNNGGDGFYYSTLYLPYDVLLPADAGGKTYNAYTCKKWHNEGVNPVPVPKKTIAETTYDEGKFIPAGTPVIIRTNDDSESVTLTLPNTTTSTSLPCVFTGSYLEQLLAVDAVHDVYTLGLPMTSNVNKADNYETTGGIVAPLPEFANNGVGFYINATPNKEHEASQSLWFRNNRYVLHNKIYYRGTDAGGGAPDMRDVQFVPVIFGDGEEGDEDPKEEEEDMTKRRDYVGDNCVYDILGRKVASAEEVKAGTWYRHLSPGVYIVNGQKVFVGVGRM